LINLENIDINFKKLENRIEKLEVLTASNNSQIGGIKAVDDVFDKYIKSTLKELEEKVKDLEKKVKVIDAFQLLKMKKEKVICPIRKKDVF